MNIEWKKSGGPYFDLSGYIFSLLNMSDAHLSTTSTKNRTADKWSHVHIISPPVEIMAKSTKGKGNSKKVEYSVFGSERIRDIAEVKSMTKIKAKVFKNTNDKKNIVKIFKKYGKDGFIHKDDIEKLYKELLSTIGTKDIVENIDDILNDSSYLYEDIKQEDEKIITNLIKKPKNTSFILKSFPKLQKDDKKVDVTVSNNNIIFDYDNDLESLTDFLTDYCDENDIKFISYYGRSVKIRTFTIKIN